MCNLYHQIRNLCNYLLHQISEYSYFLYHHYISLHLMDFIICMITLFADIFTLVGSSVKGAELNEKFISADADRDVKFKQIDGFQSKVVADSTVSCATAGLPEGCKFYRDTKPGGLSHLFYYPSDSSVQYLYEMYPDQISPLEGVTNEHFIVWMRTAPLPKFRKLYGRIHQNFKKGDTLNFNINANFEVRSFEGEKALIITNSGLLGSKNPALGIAFIVIGCLSLVLAAVFLMKEYQSPRQLGHGKSV
jgi:LEM3 (ligand-effect modulator 3) family / CDC50 family